MPDRFFCKTEAGYNFLQGDDRLSFFYKTIAESNGRIRWHPGPLSRLLLIFTQVHPGPLSRLLLIFTQSFDITLNNFRILPVILDFTSWSRYISYIHLYTRWFCFQVFHQAYFT